MGFALFTQSGTFNPSSYGLSAGDVVHVAAIGGGGSGTLTTTNTNKNGAQGGTTSFGSVLTCEGGLGAAASNSSTGVAPQTQNGAALGGHAPMSTTTAWPYYLSNYGAGYRALNAYHGGCGANGFFPGVCRPSSGISGVALVNMVYGLYFDPQAGYADIFGGKTLALPAYAVTIIPFLIDHYRSVYIYASNNTSGGFSGFGVTEYAARTDGRGGSAQRNANNFGLYASVEYTPIGGLGYGAGGATGNPYGTNMWSFTGSGGNSGVFKETEYTLTADSTAVTIGTGGTAGGYSGGGCCGCVAIWW